MKCPECGSHQCKYVVNRTKILKEKKKMVRRRKNLPKKKRSLRYGGQSSKKNIEPRIDFRAKCKRCGWEGEIR